MWTKERRLMAYGGGQREKESLVTFYLFIYLHTYGFVTTTGMRNRE